MIRISPIDRTASSTPGLRPTCRSIPIGWFRRMNSCSAASIAATHPTGRGAPRRNSAAGRAGWRTPAPIHRSRAPPRRPRSDAACVRHRPCPMPSVPPAPSAECGRPIVSRDMKVEAVLVDFDGTAALHDVAEHLLVEFGDLRGPPTTRRWTEVRSAFARRSSRRTSCSAPTARPCWRSRWSTARWIPRSRPSWRGAVSRTFR